jgi:hypothetical protein
VLPAGLSAQNGLEPPTSVDDFVLKAARQAIRAAPPRPLYRAPRWAFPVGLAATVLLTFTILLNLGVSSRQHVPTETAAQAVIAQPAAPRPSPTEAKDANADSMMLERRAPAATSNARAASPRDSALNHSAPNAQSARSAPNAPASVPLQDPAAWLKKIGVLRSQGKNAEAEEELRRFRQAFPDYPLDAPAPAPEPPG